MIAEEDLDLVREQHRLSMQHPERTHTFEYRAKTAQGSVRWFESHCRAILSPDGALRGTMSIIRDVSGRKAIEASLSEAAMTDVLTGLPNRRAFRNAIGVRSVGRSDVIALLDIDHFKGVNDRFGHDAGDAVLRTFSAMVRGAVRNGDLVARLGGEEFVVLFVDTSVAEALAICDRVRADVAKAVTFFDRSMIRVTVSGGVAPIGTGGLSEALKVADAALYRAKRAGRDQFAAAA